MNPRVLPASCRQTNQRKALPARCRQHLGGAVSRVRGSWSQCMRKNERRLSMMTVQRVLLLAVLCFVFAAEFKAASAESSNDRRPVALEKLVRDDSPRVRLEALRALAKI